MTDALPWLFLLRDLSLKSALLLLAAWALTLGMRRASAAARHLVWLLTFGGLLLLPLLSMTLPPRLVPVLPMPAVPPALSAVAAPPVFTAAPPAGVLARQPTLPRPVASTPARAQTPVMSAWPRWVCRTWLLGTLLAALPLVAGWLLAVQRIRRCAPVTDPATLAFATEAARQLGVRRPVFLRSGPSVAVPVTFGLLRPTILLPDGAASWHAERLRVALLHELAHIRRGDWVVQTAARLVCALFWHNPLVWPAARMLRAEAERACDDLVLSSGIPAPDYAQHLLAMAAALSGANRPLPLAVPMAGLGPLESRLRAVLATRPRRAPSRRLAALAFLTALVVLVPLAALRPVARAARRTAPPSPIVAAVLPNPPRAVRPAPVSPSVPILSLPKGVLPMKPPTPVKTVALAALAAGLALPAVHAQPSAPVPLTAPAGQNPAAPAAASVNLPALQGAHPADPLTAPVPLPVNPAAARVNPSDVRVEAADVAVASEMIHNPPVSLDLKKVPIRQALDSLFTAGKANYTVAAGVPNDKDLVTVHLTNVPLVQALDAVLAASDIPLTFTVKGDIFAVSPLRTSPFGSRFAPIQTGDVVQKEINTLFARRNAELSGLSGVWKTPRHPDIMALDNLISRLRQKQKADAREGGSAVSPAPDKAP